MNQQVEGIQVNLSRYQDMVEYSFFISSEINKAKNCWPLVYIREDTDEASLDEWAGMNPFELTKNETVSMVKVFQNSSDVEQETESTSQMLEKKEKIIREFKELQDRQGQTITPDHMIELAISNDEIGGKWIIFIPWEEVNEVWKKLVRGFLFGDVPDDLGLRCLKMYVLRDPENPHIQSKGENAMISIKTDNWIDEARCLRVAQWIKDLRIEHVMFYKPDIYTVLEVRSRNPFGITPSVYKFNTQDN